MPSRQAKHVLRLMQRRSMWVLRFGSVRLALPAVPVGAVRFGAATHLSPPTYHLPLPTSTSHGEVEGSPGEVLWEVGWWEEERGEGKLPCGRVGGEGFGSVRERAVRHDTRFVEKATANLILHVAAFPSSYCYSSCSLLWKMFRLDTGTTCCRSCGQSQQRCRHGLRGLSTRRP